MTGKCESESESDRKCSTWRMRRRFAAVFITAVNTQSYLFLAGTTHSRISALLPRKKLINNLLETLKGLLIKSGCLHCLCFQTDLNATLTVSLGNRGLKQRRFSATYVNRK